MNKPRRTARPPRRGRPTASCVRTPCSRRSVLGRSSPSAAFFRSRGADHRSISAPRPPDDPPCSARRVDASRGGTPSTVERAKSAASASTCQDSRSRAWPAPSEPDEGHLVRRLEVAGHRLGPRRRRDPVGRPVHEERAAARAPVGRRPAPPTRPGRRRSAPRRGRTPRGPPCHRGSDRPGRRGGRRTARRDGPGPSGCRAPDRRRSPSRRVAFRSRATTRRPRPARATAAAVDHIRSTDGWVALTACACAPPPPPCRSRTTPCGRRGARVTTSLGACPGASSTSCVSPAAGTHRRRLANHRSPTRDPR